MMTNTKKVSSWKYFLALPAITLCFGLMSASPDPGKMNGNNNTSTSNDNVQEWKTGESNVAEIIDPVTGEANKKNTKALDTAIFRAVMNKAVPPSNWQQYIDESLKFPEKFKGDKISARIIVDFVIEKDGSISSPSVTARIGHINKAHATEQQIKLFEEEAIRVISSAPKFQPATQNGKIVRSYYSFPITFEQN